MERTDQTPQPPSRDSAPVLAQGTVVDDRYRIIGELGSGGMGIVYRAEHTRLVGRPVALKTLRQAFLGAQDLRPRFEREAHALAALSHPNVVAVTDYGVYAGLPYLTMELVEGKDLREVLDEGPMNLDRALDIAGQVLEGLAFAHRRGLAHRDLKPANILLQPLPGGREIAKILDFGFAKFLEPDGGGEPTHLTRSGIGFGTPAYMSPEQATGGATDARSDVYSMGVLLFEMLTGQKPFDGEVQELVHQHLVAQVPPLEEARPGCGLSPMLEAVIVKAMAKKPANRYADAAEMLAALEAVEEPAIRPAVDGAASTLPSRESSSVEMTVPAVKPAPSRDDASVRLPARGRGRGCLLLAVLLAGAGAGVALWKPELLPLGWGDRGESPDGYERVEVVVAGGEESGERPSAQETAPTVGREVEAIPTVPADVAAARDPSEPGEPAGEEPAVEEADEPSAAVEEDSTEEAATEEEEATGEEEAGTEEATAEEAPSELQNPWEQRPLPRSLVQLRRRVLRGGTVSDATIRAVREYAREHRQDARPGLLLGHAYVRRAWLSDALERYELAHRLAPESRGDPRMLRNLVWMVGTQPPVAARAAEAVATIYGAEAVDAVDGALAAPDVDDAGRERLQALRARLSGR